MCNESNRRGLGCNMSCSDIMGAKSRQNNKEFEVNAICQ